MKALFELLKKEPMPKWDGEEPSEQDIQRIRKFHSEGRFNELPRKDQDWLVKRLIPSITRYGCYPPPPEQPMRRNAK